MENPDNNAWTGNNIFAHLNDFEESVAESILETNHTETVAHSHDDRDKSAKETANNSGTGNAKIGIKIPKLEGTNKSYVLQCQEDMTPDFIDYLKEMSSSHFAANDTGK